MDTRQSKAKNKLYILVVIIVIASVIFRWLNDFNFEQTSILFIGLPALITILVIKNMSESKSLYGIVFKVITLFLLICSIFLGEGLVCILFMAPIFYGVGALIVAIYNHFKTKNDGKLKAIVLIPVLIILLQPMGIKTKPKTHTIETSMFLDEKLTFNALNKEPNFQEELPAFFKLGFPKPIAITGKGLDIGSKRIIEFESSTKGIGELVLSIKNIDETKIVFEVIKDETHINHWLTWKNIEVNLEKESGKNKVTWVTYFTCDLGPQWYFEPLEKYAVNKMNEHLLNSFFKKIEE